MLRAYAQLVRLPNLFTAWADVLLGGIAALVSNFGLRLTSLELVVAAWGLLLLASSCLYMGGMVLNDFFDAAVDLRERPQRPIPSGRVSRRIAGILGFFLLFIGWVLGIGLVNVIVDPRVGNPALLYDAFGDEWMSDLPDLGQRVGFWLATPLVVCIVLYNAWAKHTPVGPIVMGLCRALNVGLGLSLIGWIGVYRLMLYLAPVVGLYIVGVTVFASKEATQSPRGTLLLGSAIMALAISLAGLPAVYRDWLTQHIGNWSTLFVTLLGLWTLIIALPVVRAISEPSPARVQTAVKTCILGMIGLDAVLAFGLAGWPGLLILVLLVPALLIGRWVYST
jgi:4-hydroxybenzoate polyprenyltransferase